jgi:hypothetical protein
MDISDSQFMTQFKVAFRLGFSPSERLAMERQC